VAFSLEVLFFVIFFLFIEGPQTLTETIQVAKKANKQTKTKNNIMQEKQVSK